MEAMLKLQAKYGQGGEAVEAKRAVAKTALVELEELLRVHPVRVVRMEGGGIGLDFPELWWRSNQKAWQRIAGLFWGDAFDAFVDKHGEQAGCSARPRGMGPSCAKSRSGYYEARDLGARREKNKRQNGKKCR